MLIFGLCCLLHPRIAHAILPEPEPDVNTLTLSSIFNQTRGESWKRNDNWLSNTNVCSWELQLNDNQLQGRLPNGLQTLSGIRSLDLGNNPGLEGVIGGTSADLLVQSLRYLDIDNTSVLLKQDFFSFGYLWYLAYRGETVLTLPSFNTRTRSKSPGKSVSVSNSKSRSMTMTKTVQYPRLTSPTKSSTASRRASSSRSCSARRSMPCRAPNAGLTFDPAISPAPTGTSTYKIRPKS